MPSMNGAEIIIRQLERHGITVIAGIPGALFAVPLAAFINVFALTISSGSWRTGEIPEGDVIWSTVPRERRRRSR